MKISRISFYYFYLIIFINSTICYASADMSPAHFNEEMSSFNKRVRFYFKCLRRKCTIEERNAALKAVLVDVAILTALVMGAGLMTKYGFHRYAMQKLPTDIQKLLTDIQNKKYPIMKEFDGESLEIDYNEELNPDTLQVTMVSDTINYNDMSFNLKKLIEQIFTLKNPYFKNIVIQLLGKDHALAYRFDLKDNNKWEKTARGIRKKHEAKYSSLPLT